jgi:hypothetical protein
MKETATLTILLAGLGFTAPVLAQELPTDDVSKH